MCGENIYIVYERFASESLEFLRPDKNVIAGSRKRTANCDCLTTRLFAEIDELRVNMNGRPSNRNSVTRNRLNYNNENMR